MPTTDPRIDAYIAASPEFAQPILIHLRAVVHAACPEVEETVKWSSPFFMYKGLLCHMVAFKAHCAFGFWKGAILFSDVERNAARGDFGRLTSIKDLPSKKELTSLIKRAMKLNVEDIKAGGKTGARTKTAPAELVVPADFASLLATDKLAHKVFDAGSTSFKREYVRWIDEAKTDATRQRRMAQAIEWLAEGKARNWKYEKA